MSRRRSARTWLERVGDHAARSKAASSDGDDSILEAQKSLATLLAELRFTLPQPRADLRAGWIEALEFLCGTGSFPQLESLLIGLRALDRGVDVPELNRVPKKGPKRSREAYEAMRALVEAAYEEHRVYENDASWRQRLNDLGTSYATVEKYRQQVADEAPEIGIRTNYALAWLDAEPADVIGAALRVLKIS